MFDKDMCEACSGMNHDYFEVLKYSGRHRKWLCAACTRDIDIPGPTAEDNANMEAHA